MARRAYNVTSANKHNKTEIAGLRELSAQLKDIMPYSSSKMYVATGEVVQQASAMLRQRIRANMAAQGWPRDIQGYTFATDPTGSKSNSKRFESLTGISKGHKTAGHPMYREWNAGKTSKSKRAKVSPGGKVGMGWPTMWELGTSKIRAKPAFRPAIEQSRAAIVKALTDGFTKVLNEYL